jgi:hypothetical protein
MKNLISRESVFDSFGGGYRLIVSSRRSEFNFPRRFDCLLNQTVFYRNLSFFLVTPVILPMPPSAFKNRS